MTEQERMVDAAFRAVCQCEEVIRGLKETEIWLKRTQVAATTSLDRAKLALDKAQNGLPTMEKPHVGS